MGKSFPGFIQLCGVKQGCPLSMLLFAIAIDPLIRYMHSRLDPLSDRLGAYCDDLSLATQNIFVAMKKLAPCFFIAARELNLTLNATKTQCLLICPELVSVFLDYIKANLDLSLIHI